MLYVTLRGTILLSRRASLLFFLYTMWFNLSAVILCCMFSFFANFICYLRFHLISNSVLLSAKVWRNKWNEKKKNEMKNISTATEHWPSITEYRHSVKSLNNFFCQVYYSFSPLGIKQLNVLNSQAGGGLLWVMRLTSMDHVEQFSKNNQRSENRKVNQIEKLMSKSLFFLVTSLCLLSSE